MGSAALTCLSLFLGRLFSLTSLSDRSINNISAFKKARERASEGTAPVSNTQHGGAVYLSPEEIEKRVKDKAPGDGGQLWVKTPFAKEIKGLSFMEWLTQANPKRTATIYQVDEQTGERFGEPIRTYQEPTY